MKTSEQIMDKVRLHTVCTVVVLMITIVLHNKNPLIMFLLEVIIIAFWYVHFCAAEDLCDIIKIDELERDVKWI